MKKTVDAAVGVLRSGEQVLLASRPAGKPYAGYWEFPGGKVEPGEPVELALARELREELGIQPTRISPWLTREFDYPHAYVRLHFYQVWEWQGELHPHEGQQFAWATPGHIDVEPMLPANFPLLKALQLPAVMAVSALAQMGEQAFMACLQRQLQTGLKLLQWREKTLSAEQNRHWAGQVVDLAHAHGARVMINGNAQLAREVRADGLHLPSADLLQCTVRPDFEWVGASCHNAAELQHAASLQLDYVLLGSVLPTASHPGQPGLGWPAFAALLQGYSLPVYALGGLAASDLDVARQYGAHGVALLREAWNPCKS